MKITFVGATHEVTGSCYFLEAAGKKFLVDCGMEQGPDNFENIPIPVPASELDFVLLTHAHIDHSGKLPVLYAEGFRGNIYTTYATVDLCEIMLRDSAHIQMFEAEWRNRKGRRSGKEPVQPLYDMNDAQGAISHLVGCPYQQILELADGIQVRFVDAGHLLGSASIELWLKEDDTERKIVFSGDIGNKDQPLIKNPTYLQSADYVVMESTYGDRSHGPRASYEDELARVIQRTFDRGGNVVIPSFAVGRTQEMLYFIRRIKSEHLLPEFENFEVYIDSPLAVEATSIFNKSVEECFDEDARALVQQGINPIGFPGLKMAITSDESKMINFNDNPKVIISASGMCEAGRIRHHLKHNLWRKDSTILFVGYQVPGTLGFSLLNGAKEVRLFGETIEVAARIENLPGISGHADVEQLTKWAAAFENKPKKVFVVHGEDKVTEQFADHLKDTLGYEAYAPFPGDAFDLATGEQVREGSRERAEKKITEKSRASSNVFARLLAAGQRLLAVINKCEGMPNKELGKFADQINALCNKWDR